MNFKNYQKIFMIFSCPGTLASTLDTNKYKFLTKILIDDIEVVKGNFT